MWHLRRKNKTKTTITSEQRVDLGFEFLDENYGPAWVSSIDLNTLDISSPRCCVLGQLTGSASGFYEISMAQQDRVSDGKTPWAEDHGFVYGVDCVRWRKRILARREELARLAPPTRTTVISPSGRLAGSGSIVLVGKKPNMLTSKS